MSERDGVIRALRMSRFAHTSSILLFVLSYALVGTAWAQQPLSSSFRIAVSAGVHGDLATVTCDRSPTVPALVSVAAQLAGESFVLAIDAGGLFGSSALPKLLLERDADAVARAVVAAGLRVLAVGHDDLAAARATFLLGARALAAHGIPYVLSNLECDPQGRPLCEAVIDAHDPPLLLPTEAGTVAVVAAVSPTVLDNVARDRAAGIRLVDPAQAIRRTTAAARAAGAAWIVAIYDPESGDEVRDALTLAARFTPGQGPDVLMVNGISDRLTMASTAGGHTLVVATRPSNVVMVEPGGANKVWPATSGPVPVVVDRFAASSTEWLCRRYDRPLPGGVLSQPLSEDGFAALLLDVLREHARAEVAVINRGALSARGVFPIRGAITGLHVVSAMPFDNALRVAHVKGSVLKDFVRSPRATFFHLRGLTLEGGDVRINGRPVDADLEYRVITTDYVADGGDGGVASAGTIQWEPFGSETVRDVFLRWLEQPRTGDITAGLVDPARRTRWTLRYTLDIAFTSVVVQNPSVMLGMMPTPAFTDPQLARAQTLGLRGETELRAEGDHPRYVFESVARLRYGVANTVSPMGTSSGLVETADLIVGRMTGIFRAFQDRRPVWFHPLPYLDSYLESEFSRPDSRRFHHLEWRPTGGVRFQLFDPFSVYVGVGATWELLAQPEQLHPPGPPLVPVVVGGWALRPGPLFRLGWRSFEAESTLDALWRDPLGAPGAQIRFRFRLSIPILQPMSLTIGYDAFARLERFTETNMISRDVWAFAGDLNVGFKIAYARAMQSFAF